MNGVNICLGLGSIVLEVHAEVDCDLSYCEEDTTMMSNHYFFTQDILSEIQVPQKGILSHTLYNDEQAKIILFGFAAGEELTAHTAPMPAMIQILSGEVTLTLGPDRY